MLMSKHWADLAKTAIDAYWHQVSDNPELMAEHLHGGGAIAALEAKLCQHYNKRYALCVSNATMGLFAIALALDLKDVAFVTTPYTYGASLAGFLQLGNIPQFAELDPVTLTLDANSIPSQITSDTQAILAVDIFGNPCDSHTLRQVADNYGIWYIADAAQSLGGERDGRPASVFADALVVSFTVGKSVFAGEGGAILTDHDDLYQKLIWLTQHPHRQRRDINLYLDNEFALNARIHPLAATIANATFEPALAHLRQHQAECFRLINALNAIELTKPIHFQANRIRPSFFRLVAQWQTAPQESELRSSLQAQGFQVTLESPPIRFIPTQASFLAQCGDRGHKFHKSLSLDLLSSLFCLRSLNRRELPEGLTHEDILKSELDD